MTQTHMIYSHPQPILNRLTHYGIVALLATMLITVPLQLFLAFMLGWQLFLLSPIFTLLLSTPLVMWLSATPALSLSDQGIFIQPIVWRKHLIPWDHVLALKPYPLLPTRNHEVGKRALQGRKAYRAAEGIMLIVRDLPLPYRISAYFAGERQHAIIAITNRTHTDYDHLVRTLERYLTKASS